MFVQMFDGQAINQSNLMNYNFNVCIEGNLYLNYSLQDFKDNCMCYKNIITKTFFIETTHFLHSKLKFN